MKLEAYLRKIKNYFLLFIAGLFVCVGGTSYVFGSLTLPSTNIAASPTVGIRDLNRDFQEISSRGKVAGANTESQLGQAQSVPVLVYHGVVEQPNGTDIPKQEFIAQMEKIKNEGWQTIGVEDFLAFVQGRKTLPAKSLLLTFDDGRNDTFYAVDPVLRFFGLKAVMFVISGSSFNDKTTYYVNRTELAYMKQSGRWDLQSHAQAGHDAEPIDAIGNTGHFLSSKLWLKDLGRLETEEEYKQRIRHELASVKEDLARELGVNAVSFAFPFGDYGQDSVNVANDENIVLAEVGKNYQLAFGQVRQGTPFTQNYPQGNDQLYLAERITVENNWDQDQLIKVLEAGSPKDLPFAEDFSNGQNWILTWGGKQTGLTGMKLAASENSTGASAYLDGGRDLANYDFDAVVDFEKGDSLSLISRYRDEQNYLSCNYSAGSAVMRQRVNGIETEIVSRRVVLGKIHQPDLSVGMHTDGEIVRCMFDGEAIIAGSKISPFLASGSVGFKVWDPVLQNAILNVDNVFIK